VVAGLQSLERVIAVSHPLKTKDLLRKIKDHIRSGTYVVSRHAIQRQHERLISLDDVLYVLQNGLRREDKDLFDTKRQSWKYAIHGKTMDGAKIRVIISFEEEMVIITVMVES
jgi:hypothetical protein